MKIVLYGVFALALIACSPAADDAEWATDTMATTETTATVATETAAPAASEEKPMSEYQDKVAEIKTTRGDIHIRFFPDVAPNHVKNFIDLAQKGFYDGTKFHRIIPGFMIQGGDPNTKSGDPNTWGTGGSEQRVRSEFSAIPHRRGIVSMARSNDPNSASSQFFIVVKDSSFLDNNYTVFGQVTKGMEVADKIVDAPRGANDRPNDPVSIQSITIRPATETEKGPAPR
ncbi:MAG TPA: peptidylprolyl isomerase [Thermoanaerobaculia bacterium]|nr:peptidylprolyl isomerase [Thermoanaerobaculia bacterium]